MSHLSILSIVGPTSTHSGDSGYYTHNLASTSHSKLPLELPDAFLAPTRSRSNSTRPSEDGVKSLPSSPINSGFPQRPVFRRSATSSVTSTGQSAFSTASDTSTKYDGMHYAQTHFSRSTLLVYPNSEHPRCIVVPPPQEKDEDIQELLAASSDEELSQPPSTPGLDARIPKRLSSVSILRNKQSMESDKSASSSQSCASETSVPTTTTATPAAPLRREKG
ncbi:hypothetical protein BCV70DRAFT_41559 [Testicularia cyperi]|uniref:Uncharacterized protein n=1 Tax=Testicularia cyperi TaxID=1882483 RepID=A0A317XIT8_9BASI|nr:hypothetical protein BCV70DRAFT_41559 [Testicularia cyperi]